MASITSTTVTSPSGVGQEPPASEAALSLGPLVRILQRRRRPFVVAAALVGTLTFGRTLIQEVFAPVYEGQFTLLISNPVRSQTEQGGGTESGGAIASLARNSQATDVPTLIQVLQSSSVLEPVINKMRLEGYRSIPPIAVQLVDSRSGRQSAANPLVASGILAIRGSSTDAKSLTRMLDLTQQAYLDWSLQQRRLKLSEGIRFLDQQEPILRERNSKLQEELKQFRQTNNLLEPESDAKLLSDRMLSLQGQMLQLSSARQQLMDIRRDVQAGRLTARSFNLGSLAGNAAEQGATGSGAGSGLAAGLPSQGLLDEWQRLESAIGAARGQYQPNSPVLRGLIASQQRLRPALLNKQLQAVDAALRQNSDAMASLRKQQASLQKSFSKQPELLSEYESLQQQITIAASNLENYLKTRDQFQLEQAQNTTPWQVISPSSVQRSSASTGLGKGLLQALLLGLAAGVAAAVAKDRLDHVFHSPQEVERDLACTLLGHMPYVSLYEGIRNEQRLILDEPTESTAGGKDEEIHRYQRFYYQEAMRNIYTSLRFAQASEMPRSLGITSSVPSEGKSLVAILLAKSLSDLGVRTLIVDADLRKPQVHLRLGLDNLMGLSNLLTDPQLHWQDVVETLHDHPNMSIIPAGRRVPNPPRLLGSTAMADLVRELGTSGRFDVVLYDAPPVLGLADAALLSEHLDGLMLLVSLNRVDRDLPRQALKRLEQSNTNLLGVITNARRPRGEAAGAYAYGYGRARQNPYSYAGYGALDPASAYAYYEGDSNKEHDNSQQPSLGQNLRKRLRTLPITAQIQRFNSWLDS